MEQHVKQGDIYDSGVFAISDQKWKASCASCSVSNDDPNIFNVFPVQMNITTELGNIKLRNM